MRTSQKWPLALSLSLLACAKDDEAGNKLLEVLVVTTGVIDDAIAADAKLLTAKDGGFEVKGAITTTGALDFGGWRIGGKHSGSTGAEDAFGERLTLSFSNWTQLGVALGGRVVLVRHSVDWGQPGGTVSEASRTASYRGRVTAKGGVAGTFDIDINSYASGNTQWTCGVINDKPQGQGRCY
jgi:hypothetical protein